MPLSPCIGLIPYSTLPHVTPDDRLLVSARSRVGVRDMATG